MFDQRQAAPAGAPRSGAPTLAEMIRRTEAMTLAFNTGEARQWYELARPADDVTLMAPFGGPTVRGFDSGPDYLARLSRLYRNGDARLEGMEAYASEDLIVLAFVERQRIEVHGLPSQDWSLRVTQVYRRDGADWELVHRHADPMVRALPLERVAAIARGD